MLIAIASALLASTAPGPSAANVQVDVGRFEPGQFAAAALRQREMPHDAMLRRVETILREGQCTISGQNHRRFDIRVPYVVRLEPDGTPTRFVVADLGCAPLESFVGQVVLALAREGDFRPTGAEGPEWYSSELRFTVGPPPIR